MELIKSHVELIKNGNQEKLIKIKQTLKNLIESVVLDPADKEKSAIEFTYLTNELCDSLFSLLENFKINDVTGTQEYIVHVIVLLCTWVAQKFLYNTAITKDIAKKIIDTIFKTAQDEVITIFEINETICKINKKLINYSEDESNQS